MKSSPTLSRRAFLAATSGASALMAVAPDALGRAWRDPARLTARPGRPTSSIAAGVHELGLAAPRDALVYVPASRDPKKSAMLVVALHGAGQAGRLMINRLTPFADEMGAVLLAPDSRAGSWDAIRGEFGPDVTFIDRAMRWVFERVAIDPARVVVSGFSDGASYALSLGIANGDLFPRIIAFSPGFVIPVEQEHGRPAIFVSHGVKDQILPIGQTSRRLVPVLKRAGYAVRYDEFDGGHQMPPEIISAAAAWAK